MTPLLLMIFFLGLLSGGAGFPSRKTCGLREAQNLESLRSYIPVLKREVAGFSARAFSPTQFIPLLTSSILESLTQLSECVDMSEETATEIQGVFGILIDCFCQLLAPVLINPTEANLEFILGIATSYIDFLCNILQVNLKNPID